MSKEQSEAKTAQTMLDKVYKSTLWQEIQDNFQAFDELIESDELRDFYKRLIWELVTSKIAGLEHDRERLKRRVTELENAILDIEKAYKPILKYLK